MINICKFIQPHNRNMTVNHIMDHLFGEVEDWAEKPEKVNIMRCKVGVQQQGQNIYEGADDQNCRSNQEADRNGMLTVFQEKRIKIATK
ncbi:unnamed protein product [Paramecium octaurelia]|uniref:Uncharacterized protein n=1 Tax=Paramecium octaurelia TaxID=43137 RepID=A0A8S1VLB6_PAROT|nr:unnamed protein product [Paramecium octaurelia]